MVRGHPNDAVLCWSETMEFKTVIFYQDKLWSDNDREFITRWCVQLALAWTAACLSSVYLSQAFPIQVRKRLLFSTLSLFNLSRACLGKIGVFPQSYGSSKTALWSQERPQPRSVPRTAMIRTRSHSMSFCRRQRRLGLKSRNQLQIEVFSRS